MYISMQCEFLRSSSYSDVYMLLASSGFKLDSTLIYIHWDIQEDLGARTVSFYWWVQGVLHFDGTVP